MSLELNLRFPSIHQVIVRFGDRETDTLNFASPLTEEEQKDIRWYLEVYAAQYTADVDDQRAEKIIARLPEWGEKLFKSVFADFNAQSLFSKFYRREESGRLVTISAEHPAILSLPWELLSPPGGDYLFHEEPRISIRRRLAGTGGTRSPFAVETKDCLRLLFIVSRPSDVSFIDPRADAIGVLDALDEEATGRVEVEFLRPATLDNLVKRLERKSRHRRQPPVDIIHFDGHGVFDAEGYLDKQEQQPNPFGFLKGKSSDGRNTGYLLFEKEDGKKDFVSADKLGGMLNRKKVGLIVLSACESAKVAGEEAMGSVAARLAGAGIPAVLAMTHSVLVETTRRLFASFYEHLAYGEGIGEALDDARRYLYQDRERGRRQRGGEQITLELNDWFLPALYQAGDDTPLLTDREPEPIEVVKWGNLPELQEAGFFGRSRELWQIERWFVQGTRRIAISGFGGQGKTYLAAEAGRWLYRTGMFEKVCFVNYAVFQGMDAVALAVSTLGTVLAQSLLDAAAATEALRQQPTLLILDNLESLQPQPLRELLDVAKQWSEVGNCRVLLTTRMPDFAHPDYATEGCLRHRSLPLQGLAAEDALAYFQMLMKLPPAPQFELPERRVLLELFKLVAFHPLSIGLLARQLKVRRPAELGQRLEALLIETPDNPLLASLNLSLERLDAEAQQLLPRLGVFQGGAFEDDLLAITEFSESQWQILRPALEATGLIMPEHLPGIGVPYLKFHPTLAPALWSRLSSAEQTELLARHRQRYYLLSDYLSVEDSKYPHQIRAIALRELPNLLSAVYGALDAGEESAVDFVRNVNWFLYVFGLNRDHSALNKRVEQAVGEVGSQTWYLARGNIGEQLFSAGSYQQAAQVFREILAALGEQPSYNHCITLNWLGRCLRFQGQAAEAAARYRQGLAVAEKLEASDGVKQQMGNLQADLADVLTDMGDYGEARIAYEKSLAIDKELGDARGEAVANGQLGTLALVQGNLSEAAQRYQEALTIFQRLQEPETEAVFWHQLGRVHGEAKQWEAAEQAYRESARIEESQGNLAGAARTWNQLALVNEDAGKPGEAEAWYRKAIAGAKAAGDRLQVSWSLNNLANLLQNQPNRLPEARQLAEEALAIMQTLDPAAAEIWTTYQILAEIADKQSDTVQAREYRRLSREARATFAGTRYELQKYGQLIAYVVAAVDNAELRQQLEPVLEERVKNGWGNLVAAIHQILDGERDQDVLCEPLDMEDSMIIYAILQGIGESG